MANSGYDLVLNVMAPCNRNPHFYPLQDVLIGTVRMSELRTDKPNGALLQVDMEIPGQQLQIDTALMHVKVIDRMTLPEFAEKDRKLRKLCQTEQYSLSNFRNYRPDIDTQVASKDWPTWLYHIRILVNAGRLHIEKGHKLLPSIVSILKMCPPESKVRIQTGDSCGGKAADPDRPFYLLDARDAAPLEQVGVV